MKRNLVVAIGLIFSALFVWLSFRNTSLEQVITALRSSDPGWSIPFLLLLFLFYWLKSVRWKLLLSPSKILPSKDLFPVVMIGYAWTAILPMQMGEFVRAYVASKRYGMSYSLVLGSIGLERIFDLLTILLLFGLVMSISESMPAAFTNAGLIILMIATFATGLCILLVTKNSVVLGFIKLLTSRLPIRVSSFVVSQTVAISSGVSSIADLPLVSRIVANSLAQWVLMGGCVWISLAAVNIDVPLPAALLTLVATIVGISLPTSPGYIGNIQFAFVASLTVYGIDPARAVAASFFYHVIAYMAVVIVGFTYMKVLGVNTSNLRLDTDRSAADQ